METYTETLEAHGAPDPRAADQEGGPLSSRATPGGPGREPLGVESGRGGCPPPGGARGSPHAPVGQGHDGRDPVGRPSGDPCGGGPFACGCPRGLVVMVL